MRQAWRQIQVLGQFATRQTDAACLESLPSGTLALTASSSIRCFARETTERTESPEHIQKKLAYQEGLKGKLFSAMQCIEKTEHVMKVQV